MSAVKEQPRDRSRGGQNPDIDDLLPSDLIAQDEVVIFAIKPSLWSIPFLSFRTVAVAALVTAAALALGPTLGLGQMAVWIVEACAVVAVGRVGFAFLQWLSRTYVLTDKRVMRIRGVFTIDIFQCALGRVQNTFLVLPFWQRFFDLGSIELTTAGTGLVEAVWRHCRHPLAVHQQLLQAINRATVPPSTVDELG